MGVENSRKNIILIGMPSAGKSTLGVLLAKALGYAFLDTDILIQAREGKKLFELIQTLGPEAFIRLEGQAICSLDVERTVIATGGSVVYDAEAMGYLKRIGMVFFLDVPCDEVRRRLGDASLRGIVMKPGQPFKEMYAERKVLYQRYADKTVSWWDGAGMEDMVNAMVKDNGKTRTFIG